VLRDFERVVQEGVFRVVGFPSVTTGTSCHAVFENISIKIIFPIDPSTVPSQAAPKTRLKNNLLELLQAQLETKISLFCSIAVQLPDGLRAAQTATAAD